MNNITDLYGGLFIEIFVVVQSSREAGREKRGSRRKRRKEKKERCEFCFCFFFVLFFVNV